MKAGVQVEQEAGKEETGNHRPTDGSAGNTEEKENTRNTLNPHDLEDGGWKVIGISCLKN